VGTPPYERAVQQLGRIRAQAPNIRYAYILRGTADPNTMQFVADADSLHPDQPVDLNGDGRIDDEDALTFPGDAYDVSEFPEFRTAAFMRPFVDPDFTVSQWGVFLAGTAPIRDPDTPGRPTRYVIGLDLEVTQYEKLLARVFIPFLAFTAFLLTIISLQAVALRQLWKRQVRQLIEIDRQKDELIGIVSHQLASPVASVRWSLQDLLDGEFGAVSSAQKQHLADMLRSIENLGELTQLLLDVSRIELGRLKIHREPIDLRQFFGDLIVLAEEQAKQKQVRLVQRLPKTWPAALLDPRLTRMTLENLLSNAVKYSPMGGTVTLEVEVADGTLVCRIADTGMGIPLADQPHIFEKLFRASNVQQVDGNGFGLYVAKGAIEQQGGRLWFTSQQGQGTTFYVRLPLA
jgi:signal transduction histidine kinase